MARTTCQSFSTSPSHPGRSWLATSSTSCRSSTFEAHHDAVVADFPPNPFIDGYLPARRDLCRLARGVVLFKAGRCSFDAEATESFVVKTAPTSLEQDYS